jgi:uncharacterized protein YjbI with pentapeptide repeats
VASSVANEERRPPIRRALAITAAVLLLAGFVWLWWKGVPALYQNTQNISEAERLKATTDTRTALLAGLAVGALGTFWFNARRQRFTRAALWVLAGIGVLGLVGWALWKVPPMWYDYVPVPKDRAGAEAATRTGLIAGLAGLAALGGLAVAHRTYRLTQQGQLTDRYSKAIEQLGGDKLDVRLGGIYALEQLAWDSKNDRDQATIVEVLSAFVRVHSASIYRYRHHLEWLGQKQLRNAEVERHKAEDHVREVPLPVDVQAAVTVLGRLRVRPDVKRADLSGACLRKVKLDPEDNLTDARLGDKADLTEAKLNGVVLNGVDLHGANLTEARLEGAKLRKAWLAGAHLNRAHLVKADLADVTLVGVRANGNWYSLGKARQELSKEVLSRADWSRADLSEADLSEALGLTQEQLDEALGDSKTTLPSGLHHPEQWSRAEGSEPG